MSGRATDRVQSVLTDLLVHHREDPSLPYHARDPYVERFWLPKLGPTGLVVLRRLALDAELVEPNSAGKRWSHYEPGVLAAAVGVAENRLRSTLWRLASFGFAESISPANWAIDVRLPAVSPRHFGRYPARIADELRAGVS